MISKEKREDIYNNIKKKINSLIAKDIENSIYIFSEKYADDNGTPFLIDNIYDTKAEEVLCILNNNNLKYIIKGINENKIDPKKFAFLKPAELNPEKFSDIIKKKQKEEMRMSDIGVSSAFECEKCKKNKCSIVEKQIRSGDEPATAFITCLECGHVFMM